MNPDGEITVSLPAIDFPPISERVHGEVCMAIRRKNGGFLLQTKESYPDSVMRLPSGGIKAGERTTDALMREVWEETNLSVEIEKFVASINYCDVSTTSRFRTYLFLVRETGGVFGNNDPKEKISDWVEAQPAELAGYADALRGIVPEWRNWGYFRASAIDILSECLNV